MADDSEDLLGASEIEALLNASGGGAPSADSETSDSAAEPAKDESAGAGDLLAADDIDALLNSAAAGGGAEAASDDLLAADDIDALLSSAGAGAPAAAAGAPDDLLAADDIDALLAGAGAGAPAAAANSTDALLDAAEANLAAAVDPNLGGGIPAAFGDPKPYAFEAFDSVDGMGENGLGWNAIQEVELDLVIELGRTELLIEEVLKLKDGAVVALDKLAGDPVDVLVNGRLIARGEVLVLNDNFCVRIAEILVPEL